MQTDDRREEVHDRDVYHDVSEDEAYGDEAPEHESEGAADSQAVPDPISELEARHVAGANWFYWIAALSLVNAFILMIGGDRTFIIGLGVTTFVGAVAQFIAEEEGGNVATVVQLIAFAVSVGIAGMVVLFGVLARKRYVWAFLVGMGLYVMDGLLFLLVGDWLSVGFHVFVLFMLAGGLSAAKQLNALEQPTAPPAFAE